MQLPIPIPMEIEIEAGLLANEQKGGVENETDGPMVEIDLNDAIEAVGLGAYHYRVTHTLFHYVQSLS